MTARSRTAPPRSLLFLLLVALLGLTAPDSTALAQTTGPAPQTVPHDWDLIPDGLGPGDQFRLLFVTSGTRDATSGNINDYNTFVQNAANGSAVDATIKGMSGHFRALVSTAAVNARDNTVTTGTGVRIYWLDGARVADDYADFYDNSWDSLARKNEEGSDFSGSTGGLVWTGTNSDGTSATAVAGSANVRYGRLWPISNVNPLSSGAFPNYLQQHVYALSPVLTVGAPPAPLTYEVPNDWALKPSGLGVDDEFRLLVLTSTTRNATSRNIIDYNTHAADAVAGGHYDIRAYSTEFRALASTEGVDARDNTVTTGTGVDIYWLNGAKAADDYGDFYDGSWDSTEARDEDGDTFTTNPEAWTGSASDGTEAFNGTTSRALGAGLDVRYGDVDSAPLSDQNSENTGARSVYAISPVFKVVAQGAPAGQDVPGDWPLIPSGLGGGDQFRLLFVTSLERSAESANIGDYNAFVQGHAGGGHAAIRPYRNEFRALASTSAVDAIDNTATTGTGVPIYVLSVDAGGNFNGAKVADDYADLYDGVWAATASWDESGDASSDDQRVWTGTDDDTGQESSSSGLGHDTVQSGIPHNTGFALSFDIRAASNEERLYSLSPVFTVLTVDYDTDDGLIEVGTLAQLDAIRHDLSGDGAVDDGSDPGTAGTDAAAYAAAFPNPEADQCDDPNTGGTTETCTGYELATDLDFDENGDGNRNDTYNTGAGWLPIGGRFAGVFEGNGHTIANLFINRGATDDVGLFGAVSGAARNLGLADANVTGGTATGALAGTLVRNATISASWATGSVTGRDAVGGLVGESGFGSQIITSYAAVSVTGVYVVADTEGGEQVGGLVGSLRGGSVAASYATGSVHGDYDVGGLVGYSFRGAITASYATGRVTGRGDLWEEVGGLVGRLSVGATVTDSYFDAETTGRVFGIGSDDNNDADAFDATDHNNMVDSGETNSLPGRTTAELQDPTGYSGIYANWNLDLDDADSDDSHATGRDDPWDFGAAHNYPALKVDFNGDGTPTYQEFGVQRGASPPAMLLAAPGLDASNDAVQVVTWNVPTQGNPADPTGYQYRYSSDAGATWNPDWPAAETDANWLDAATRTFTIPAPLADRYEVEVRAIFAAPLPIGEARRTVAGGTDYDADDDGLIEVASLAQLNAIRGDVDGNGVATDNTLTTSVYEAAEYAAAFPSPAFGMGCPLGDHDGDSGTDPQPVCSGYELTTDLDFDEDGDDSRDDTYNTGSGWEPIGSFRLGYFEATFEGNGHTIANLFINRGATDGVGLFGETLGTVRNLGLEDADVTGQDRVGALAGYNNGVITHSWATGSVTGRNHVGGLIGEMGQWLGTITSSSYAAVRVVGSGYNVGGLVGHVANGNVLATYATGSVTGTEWVGGLVGYNNEGAITASYATGSVTGTENAGGLVGGWFDSSATITNSYFDAQTTGRFFGIGQQDNGAGTNADNNVVDAGETNSLPGGTTSALQFPTGYTGIYANWNLDLDNADDDANHATGRDDPWDFGANDQYPILKNVGGVQRPEDYDSDNDGLIEIRNLAQLNAIRWDLDGDGSVTNDANTADLNEADAYDDAFPGPVAGMGCTASGCTGYELVADLNFDANGDGSITSADAAYWDGGAGWDPLGDDSNPFAAVFEGNGHTISNLFINRGTTDYVGLFGAVASGDVVRNVGVADAEVRGRDYVGALVGENDGRVSASWTSGSVTATDDVGGLVGRNQGVIAASYSSATVNATGSDSINAGGLVGSNVGTSASILASYATGGVDGDGDVGGLVGTNDGGVITASYSTGAPSGNSRVGGLLGANAGTGVSDSYWDTERSEQATSDAGTGKTGAELREPTGYTGIYASWNLDLDGNSANDDPWDFGADYNYPTLGDAPGNQKGPGPVSGLTAAPNDEGNLDVTWSAPTDVGDGTLGSALGGVYAARYTDDNGVIWILQGVSQAQVAQYGPTFTIASPVASAHRIEVWALGGGTAHAEGKRASIGLPGPPQMSLTSSSGQVDVSWSAPADTGGSDIAGYRLQYRVVAEPVLVDGVLVEPDWTTLTLPVTPASHSITGLVAGETYQFRLAATNADGTGVYAGPLNAIASDVVNYDSDGNGLIEIRSLAQLNAVRWDGDGDGMVADDTSTADIDEADAYAAAFPQAATGMGCPATGCTGYELMVDLNFDTDRDGDVDGDDSDGLYWNGGEGWDPLGIDTRFTAVFDGNGHTIANLFIEGDSSADRLGLFSRLGDNTDTPEVGATVRNLVLTGANVTGDDRIGILAGQTYGPTAVSNVSVSGSVTAGDDYAGGLIGVVGGDTTIASSYSSASVSASGSASAKTGGLVGENEGSILASYATGGVSGAADVGGLAGDNSGDITASYSTGAVSSSGSGVGGLVGTNSGTVTNSYWDTETSGQATSAGGTGKTSAELRAPTGYTGIYSAWNLDLDNADDDDSHSTGQDNPWDFGRDYNYPTLRDAPGNQKRPGPVGTIFVGMRTAADNRQVSWAAPGDSGDGEITGYEYRISTDGGSTWPAGWEETGSLVGGRSFTFNALAGNSYTIETRAVSDAAHKLGASRSVGPPQNAPQNPTVLAYTGRVDLSWDAPQDDGGPAITGYAVEYRADGGTTWLTTGVTITGRKATITGLTDGTPYNLRVAAVSLLGPGAAYATIDGTPTAQHRNPGAPTDLKSTPGQGTITLSWKAPEDLGNPPLTGYTVQWRTVGQTTWPNQATATTTTTTINISGDGPFEVRVGAVNSGATTYMAAQRVEILRPPGAPRHLGLYPGDGRIEVAWSAPADPGIPAFESYLLQYRKSADGVWQNWPHSRTAGRQRTEVTGLDNGAEYLVRVAAVSSDGAGAFAKGSATPYRLQDLPGVPGNLRVYPSDSRLDVRWEAPEDLGDPELTHYRVSIRQEIGGAWKSVFPRTVDAPDTTTVYKNLVNGRSYQVHVAACNRLACSLATGPVVATPQEGLERPDIERPPSAPRNLRLEAGDEQITVSWKAPSDLGKPAAGAYLVEHRRAGTSDDWTQTRTGRTTATLRGLTNGQAYEVQVTAYNDHGGGVAGPQSVGPAAADTEPEPEDPDTEPEPEDTEPEPGSERPPTAPRNLRLEAGDGWIKVSWNTPRDIGDPDAWIGYSVETRTVGAAGSGGWFEEGVYQGTSATIDATNGQSYQVRVIAVNEHGQATAGPHTARPTAPEPDEDRPPTAPRSLSLEAGDGQIVVSWQKPWDMGEEDAWLGYIVEFRGPGTGGWLEVGVYQGTSATIDYVDNGETYEVRVTAFNLHGQATAGPKRATPAAQ